LPALPAGCEVNAAASKLGIIAHGKAARGVAAHEFTEQGITTPHMFIETIEERMMQEFGTIDQILDFAIGKEQEAADMYSGLAKVAAQQDMRDVFQQFAAEELGHKAKLLNFKKTGETLVQPAKVADMKIGDYLIDVEIEEHLSYQKALILAMKLEKAAYKLYYELALVADNASFKQLLMVLANEEAKHKLRFEIEYDENILKEN
jgi:rubrerythrin